MRESLARLSSSRWAPWIVFGVALATRILGAVLGGVHSDDGDNSYRQMATAFLGGQGLSIHSDFGRVYSWLPPGMGLIFSAFIPFFGFQLGPARIVFVLFSAMAAVWLFFAAKRMLIPEAAFLAALLWALYPPQWFWASRVNPQVYATNVVVLCVLLMFLSWEKKSGWLALVAGFLWGTAALCRGEYVLGFVVLSAWSLLAVRPLSSGVKIAALVAVGWSLVFGPWVVRNYRIHHRFILVATNYGDNFWKAYNPAYHFSGVDIPFPPELKSRLLHEPNEIGRADLLKEEAFKFIRENPGRAARNVLGNAFNFWRPWLSSAAASPFQNTVYVLSYLPIFILFLWGVGLVPWKNPAWGLILSLILYKFAIHIFFYVIVRYREAIFPLLALVAALPVQTWWSRSAKESRDRRA